MSASMGKAADTGRLSGRQRLVVGATLFSMFFGAGNLILPPLLGVQAGAATPAALAGFFVAGVDLPVLGIVAVALSGTVRELADRVHPLFSRLFVAAVYLAIGPCLAIPRTASTAFEMVVPLLSAEAPLEAVRLAFSAAFFVAAWLLALRPGRLTRFLGRITGPALIALIVAVVVPGVSSLVSGAAADAPAPVAPYDGNAAVQGFLTGYQTMDLLASLTFGIVIAQNIRALGVAGAGGVTREVCIAGTVAGILLAAIYAGLAVVGVDLSATMAGATNGASVIAASAAESFGLAGSVMVAAIFLLACLNVCTGLISCCGSYFAGEVAAVPYRAWAAGFAIFSCALANAGLDWILAFSVPLLSALYPVAIVLVAMGMASHLCDRFALIWPVTVAATGAVSIVQSLRDALAPGTWLVVDALPLAEVGLTWVVPALAAAAVGLIASSVLARRAGAQAGR